MPHITNYPEYVDTLFANSGKLDSDGFKGYLDWEQTVLKDGAISGKIKKLMAVALSIQGTCPGCIGIKTSQTIEAGATRQEFLEMLNVAMLMGGGPSVAHATYAIEAFEQFDEKAKR